VKVGRAVRFDMVDLERFVTQNRIEARAPAKFLTSPAAHAC
jgi:hypothetical protein